ncbi:MAG: sulfide/dihydroorotate dehydrogenase-like FAD/NAD-binding protein [Christensenellaceae bacterium]|jgi:ferredoxin--NADP+ reductase|nr:sulfide/dihydroorotate dehydrogenase-like FAD/NAD-binding protein [Christensenellaceae bacterium]
MYQIIAKRVCAPEVIEYVIYAPVIASSAAPGQFVMLRVDENGERVPFTICDFDRLKGSVTILVQTVGVSTYKLSLKNAGDDILDLAGPFGEATDLKNYSRILLVAGGIGVAVIYPQAKVLNSKDCKFDVILGVRNSQMLVYSNEIKILSDYLYITSDDGSVGIKGFVTDKIGELLNANQSHYDLVFAVGPPPMMRAVCEITKRFNIKTIVSLNSIMLDGTGMCGCCRVTIGGQVKYSCVHGPEFDGHLVDWNEVIFRSKRFNALEKEHYCKLRGL